MAKLRKGSLRSIEQYSVHEFKNRKFTGKLVPAEIPLPPVNGDFRSTSLWTDGTDIYFSRGNMQYVLNRESNTWDTKIWTAEQSYDIPSYDDHYIWSDGINIYLGSGSSSSYPIIKNGDNWEPCSEELAKSLYVSSMQHVAAGQLWNDLEGNLHHGSDYIWKGSSWEEISWSERVDLPARCMDPAVNIWTDGTSLYCSCDSGHYILNNNQWEEKNWGLSLERKDIAAIGDQVYAFKRGADNLSMSVYKLVDGSFEEVSLNFEGMMNPVIFDVTNVWTDSYEVLYAPGVWTDGKELYAAVVDLDTTKDTSSLVLQNYRFVMENDPSEPTTPPKKIIITREIDGVDTELMPKTVAEQVFISEDVTLADKLPEVLDAAASAESNAKAYADSVATTAESNAKTYTDDLNTAMDTRVTAIENSKSRILLSSEKPADLTGMDLWMQIVE